MASDYQMLRNGITSLADFQKLQEEFELKKKQITAQTAGQDPAALKLVNEYEAAIQSGDVERANRIASFAKIYDKGVIGDVSGGGVGTIRGYGDAVGSIAGTRKAYEANAQNASDLYYDPQTAELEAAGRQRQELAYANQIANERKAGEVAATQVGDLQKKADNAANMGGLTDQARAILQTGKPTGSYGGAALAFGKRVIGQSDESTQANAALDVIAGNLTGNVPRFEGPQSDADRLYYIQMAGRVNDKTMPEQDRLSALAEIDRLNAKYESIQTPTKAALDPMAASQSAIQQQLQESPQLVNPNMTMPQTGPKKGAVVDGYMFVGGNPADQKSWKKVK